MLQVKVLITNLSINNLSNKQNSKVHISSRLNFDLKSNNSVYLLVPFDFVCDYKNEFDLFAQMSLKGEAQIAGPNIDAVFQDYKEKKPNQELINAIQTISNIILVELTCASRSFRIPPPMPLPSFNMPQYNQLRQEPQQAYYC